MRSNKGFDFVAASNLGPTGLGGWLILPILGLLFTVLSVVGTTITQIIPDLQNGMWSALTSPSSDAYHPAWAPLLSFEYVCNFLMAVFAVVVLVFLFQKKPILPRLMIGFYIFCFLFVLIDTLVALLLGPDMVPSATLREQMGLNAGSLLGPVARAALVYAIWIPYFLVSKRVRNTFVAQRPPRGFMPTPNPAWVYTYPHPDSPAGAPQSQGQTGQDLPRI